MRLRLIRQSSLLLHVHNVQVVADTNKSKVASTLAMQRQSIVSMLDECPTFLCSQHARLYGPIISLTSLKSPLK